MTMRFKRSAALIGGLAVVSGLGATIAQAGTYPRDSTYEIGGAGETLKPGGSELHLEKSSFSPEIIAIPPCGAEPWSGGCG